MPKLRLSNEPMISSTLRIPKRVRDNLELITSKKGKSFNKLLTEILEEYLENLEA